MTNTSGLQVTKPISIWNQPLKANFRDLFKSLAKAAIGGVTLNWIEVGKNAADAVTAVGLGKDAGQIAWLLIYRSIEKALSSLVEENLDLIRSSSSRKLMVKPGTLEEIIEDVVGRLDLSLENGEVTIEETFFERPRELSILQRIKIPLAQCFIECGLTPSQAASISDRLPTYFVYSLNEEWRERRGDYELLKKELDTPFTRATDREQGWSRYAAMLQKQVDEPMFYEAFSLRQVYIPLRAYLEAETTHVIKDPGPYFGTSADEIVSSAIQAHTSTAKSKSSAFDLESHLEHWLTTNEKGSAIKVISGGPGSGKSSFAKVFAANQMARGGWRILFVPLHRFELADDLINALKAFIHSEGFLPQSVFDPRTGESRLLIIFDGLDEISMQGKAASEVAERFVFEVQRKLASFNAHELRLKVIITGRELSVQANSDAFRNPEQILHILPYYVPPGDEKQYEGVWELHRIDQRQTWWKAYGKASGRGYDSMPEQLGRRELVDITSQPLLNYLVALSYTRGTLDFATETSLNLIYADLLRAVYQRVWGERPHPSVSNITEEQFLRVLEEIALAAWHGDGRVITLREVEEHCLESGLTNLLERFKEGAREGVARLLMAFYFRKSESRRLTGEETFEFTHKSFSEYLTAQRLVRGMLRVHDEMERRVQSYDGGWDERDSWEYWVKLCGPTPISQYILDFSLREIYLRHKPDTPSDVWYVQKSLSRLIGYVVRHGVPMDKLFPRPSFKQESLYARNAEESLLCMLGGCARVTNKVSVIDWPAKETFGEWLSRLQATKQGFTNPIAFDNLLLLDLKGAFLGMRDLSQANLQSVNLGGAVLSYAILKEANLTSANLIGATLEKAILENAMLEAARVSGSIITDAYLRGANLNRASFEGADLSGSDLRGVVLTGANLVSANLSKASLMSADLRGANLERAKLNMAVLKGADLDGANLKRADLSSADLRGASFRNANLEDANLHKADIRGTVFDRANPDRTGTPDGAS